MQQNPKARLGYSRDHRPAVLPCGIDSGLKPIAVIVNSQTFTKTANIWGVSNNSKGTNTNRIVLFQKKN